jgi:hypothetical protein
MDSGKLQAAVEQVDREIALLASGASVAISTLQVAWTQFVNVLALAPPRATRECPRCGKAGMREATLCGYCWMKLVPPAGDGGAGTLPRGS